MDPWLQKIRSVENQALKSAVKHDTPGVIDADQESSYIKAHATEHASILRQKEESEESILQEVTSADLFQPYCNSIFDLEHQPKAAISCVFIYFHSGCES